MSKVPVNVDGEASGSPQRQKATDIGVGLRLNPYKAVVALNPEECPASMVPMVSAANIRVGCLTGRVYIFAAGKCNFVHKADQHKCAGRGAVLQDAKAIAAAEKALAEAAELKQLRAEKAEREAAKLVAAEAQELEALRKEDAKLPAKTVAKVAPKTAAKA
jgi:hypothetical protein